MAQHKLCPTIEENVLNPIRVVLVAGLVARYEFDVAQFIVREICDRVMGTKKETMAFPYLLT